MKKLMVGLAVAALLLGCGGGGGESTTNKTAQGCAKLWLNAALQGNEARVRELTVDSSEAKCVKLIQLIKDPELTADDYKWSAEPAPEKEYCFRAGMGLNVIFIDVIEMSEENHQVSDVSVSW